MAASSHGGCNSPGESLSCSFIFDILMTTTAQDCEKGKGCLSSCCPRGDVGTGSQALSAGKRLFQQISFPVQVPLWRNHFNKAPSLTSSLALISWKKHACSFPSPSYPQQHHWKRGPQRQAVLAPVPAPTVAGSVTRYQLSLTHCSPRWFAVGVEAPPHYPSLPLLPAPCPGLAAGERGGWQRLRCCCCPWGTVCVTPLGPQLPQQLFSLGNSLLMHPSDWVPAAEIWGFSWSPAHKCVFAGF